ncbi:MAG: GspE/PulE family protein [Gammaproteobacteria bacterium]
MTSISRLVQHLGKKRILSTATLQQAEVASTAQKIPLIHYLVQQSLVGSKEVLTFAAELFQLSIYDLSTYNLEELPKDYISIPLIKQHYVLPLFYRQGHLVLAMADPSEHQAIEDFTFLFSQPCIITIVDAKQLQITIEYVLQLLHKQKLHASLQTIATIEPTFSSPRLYYQTEEAPVVAYIHQLLQDAAEQQVSDVHCEPYADYYRIRLRQDGILLDYASPPAHVAPRLAARIKVMAELNIAECRLPQDGRFEFVTRQQQAVDIRVSTCPVLHGEKIVLRLLNSQASALDIATLGLEPTQQQQLLHNLQQPCGLILVTGPTGSGKTITLYSLLQHLNNGQRNISSVEDPVEIQLSGINQVAIQPALGLDFSQVLRCFLRQDPDIIMVGEIRDAETARMACRAAQTGHLVLSTLHTQNAVGALVRLQQLGITANELASSIKLIIAQRLVRRLCKTCHAQQKSEWLSVAEPLYIFNGCKNCHQGYQGRTGIFELFAMDATLAQMLNENMNYSHIFNYAQQQGLTLNQSGELKIQQAITDMHELKRVL